jgi:hypothetical protein
MDYNNRDYGEAAHSVRKSPYIQELSIGIPTPPPEAFLLLDDSGDYLLDDSGDNLATP